MNNVAFIDSVDLSGNFYGSGGIAVAASAMRVLADQVSYVGFGLSKEAVGRWVQIAPFGKPLNVLSVGTAEEIAAGRSAANVRFALAVMKHLPAIRRAGVDSVLTGAYSVLWALAATPLKWHICFSYPGLGNPLLIGRSPRLGRLLSGTYELVQAGALLRAEVALAAASEVHVESCRRRLRRLGVRVPLYCMPTAVDLENFAPRPKGAARRELGIEESRPVFVFIGRMAAVKGVDFLLSGLREFNRKGARGMLLLAGDGEQRPALEALARDLGLGDDVRFLGNVDPVQVAQCIASADAAVVGSHVEGFSLAMVEAIACGRPLVTTAVSGARDVVVEGINGFVVETRDPRIFAGRMQEALELPRSCEVSREIAEKHFSEHAYWRRVAQLWPRLTV